MKILVLVAISIFTLLPTVLLNVLSAQALAGIPDGIPEDNVWAPYGPFVNRLQFNFYWDDNALFNAFQLGQFDLAGRPVPKERYAAYNGNPDFLLSPTQGGFDYFGVEFNQHNLTGPGTVNTWASWGCNFQHATSPCGVEIREAFAHLIDRPRWVLDGPLQGTGQALADPSPPAKDPSGSPLATQNAWDTLTGQSIAGLVHPPTVQAFNVAPDLGGFAAPGSPDFCAARDHLVAANIGLKDDNLDCIVDSDSPGLASIVAHPARFIIRNDDPRRLNLGLGFMNAIHLLFGATVVQPIYGAIANLGCIVFCTPPEGPIDDWDMYTYGWSTGGPFPDHLQPIYGSSEASDQCGGVQNGLPLNYGFVCVPSFDQHANTAARTADVNVFRTETLAALDEFGKHAANIPVYSRGFRSVALRDMAGVVNQRGAGYSNFWSVLNGRDDLAYAPVDSRYRFGGGDPTTLRWGQTQGTTYLNPFWAFTTSELKVVGEIYDTLFIPSPIKPGKVINWMANQVTQSVDANGNTHFLIELRQNLKWHDETPVTAADVKFTMLAFRDASTILAGILSPLLNVNVFGSQFVEIVLIGQRITYITDLASLPIIPRHVWELPGDLTYGDVGRVDPAKADPSYDPLAVGTLIGSGPFACKSIFPEDLGRVGTGCAVFHGSRVGQQILPGGAMVLTRFDFATINDPFYQYMRTYNNVCPSSPPYPLDCTTQAGGQFQEWSWADQNNDGIVDIVDLTSAGACVNGPGGLCSSSLYAYWHRLSTGTFLTLEVTRVASHLDDTWVGPFNWNSADLENIMPFTP